MEDHDLTRRTLLRWGMLGAGALAAPGVLAACGSSTETSTSSSTTPLTDAPPDTLLEAARAEGGLNLIAVSEEPGSAYAHVIEGFRATSKLKIDFQTPSASSGIEMETVRSTKGKPTQPDVVDVGVSAALEGTKAGLFRPVQPDGWVDIPSAAKDADGNWVSTYYALCGIASNPAKLNGIDPPATFEDLENLPDGTTFAFPGDPRSNEAAGPLASASAFGAVWAAALARGGSLDDIGPGIDFYAVLAKRGTLNFSTPAMAETFANGSVSIALFSVPDFQRAKGMMPGGDLVMRIPPADHLYPNYFAQAAVKGSPHPAAAELWISYMMSDAGAKGFLLGGLVPTRFPVMQQQGTVKSGDLEVFADFGRPVAKLTADLAAVQIPTVDQLDAAQKAVNDRWGPEVRDRQS